MSATKRSALVMACLLASSCTLAMAGNPNQSLLDPYNYVQAPAPKAAKGQKQAPPQAPAVVPQDENQATTTTFVTMPGSEFSDSPDKGKAPKASGGSSGGMLSGVNDKFKSASSGLVSGTKAAGGHVVSGTKAVGEHVASSTKKVREGIATGAKASGTYFMKSAKVIGDGIKATGAKVKDGTGAMGSKVAAIPHALPFGHGPKTQVKDEHLASKKEDVKVEDVKVAEKPPAPTPAPEAKPAKNEPAPQVAEDKQSIVGKTLGAFGKLNPFNKNKAQTAAGKNSVPN